MRFLIKIKNFFLLAKRSEFKTFIVFKTLILLYINSLFSDESKVIKKKVFSFKVYSYGYKTLLLLFEEIFLSNEYNFNSEKSSLKIIDCGSNIGMSILYFKKKFPNSEIIGFEPNPYAFELLKKNIEENELKNVTIHNLGLSDTDGEIDFFIGQNKGTLVGSRIKNRGGENNLKVQSKKLSNFIGKKNFDLIKIDVEGSEFQILNDLVDTNKINQIKFYIIEYHHNIEASGFHLSSFLKDFEDNKFKYNVKSKFNEINSYQDIMLYFFKY